MTDLIGCGCKICENCKTSAYMSTAPFLTASSNNYLAKFVLIVLDLGYSRFTNIDYAFGNQSTQTTINTISSFANACKNLTSNQKCSLQYLFQMITAQEFSD